MFSFFCCLLHNICSVHPIYMQRSPHIYMQRSPHIYAAFQQTLEEFPPPAASSGQPLSHPSPSLYRSTATTHLPHHHGAPPAHGADGTPLRHPARLLLGRRAGLERRRGRCVELLLARREEVEVGA
jgi:hypothetical protein